MPITLAQVVAQTESGGYFLAARFEPTVYARYKAVDDQAIDNNLATQIERFEQLHRCSPDTARVLLSSSFGKYQLMGFNLDQNVLAFAGDEAAQDAHFVAFCAKLGVTDDQMSDASWIMTDHDAGLAFAEKYNGPGQPSAYLAFLQHSYSLISKG